MVTLRRLATAAVVMRVISKSNDEALRTNAELTIFHKKGE